MDLSLCAWWDKHIKLPKWKHYPVKINDEQDDDDNIKGDKGLQIVWKTPNNRKVPLVKQSQIQFENRDIWRDQMYATLMQEYLDAFCSCQILPLKNIWHILTKMLCHYIYIFFHHFHPYFWHPPVPSLLVPTPDTKGGGGGDRPDPPCYLKNPWSYELEIL